MLQNVEGSLLYASLLSLFFEAALKQRSRGVVCSRISEVVLAGAENEGDIITILFSFLGDRNSYVSYSAMRALVSLLLLLQGPISELVMHRLVQILVTSTNWLQVGHACEAIKRVIEWKDNEEHPLDSESSGLPPECRSIQLSPSDVFGSNEVKYNATKILECHWLSLVSRSSKFLELQDLKDEHVIVSFLSLWTSLISVKNNLNVEDTKEFYSGLEALIKPLLNSSTSLVVWEKILDLFNEVLCYGSTLALQEVLAEEPCNLAHMLIRAVNSKHLLGFVPCGQPAEDGFQTRTDQHLPASQGATQLAMEATATTRAATANTITAAAANGHQPHCITNRQTHLNTIPSDVTHSTNESPTHNKSHSKNNKLNVVHNFKIDLSTYTGEAVVGERPAGAVGAEVCLASLDNRLAGTPSSLGHRDPSKSAQPQEQASCSSSSSHAAVSGYTSHRYLSPKSWVPDTGGRASSSTLSREPVTPAGHGILHTRGAARHSSHELSFDPNLGKDASIYLNNSSVSGSKELSSYGNSEYPVTPATLERSINGLQILQSCYGEDQLSDLDTEVDNKETETRSTQGVQRVQSKDINIITSSSSSLIRTSSLNSVLEKGRVPTSSTDTSDEILKAATYEFYTRQNSKSSSRKDTATLSVENIPVKFDGRGESAGVVSPEGASVCAGGGFSASELADMGYTAAEACNVASDEASDGEDDVERSGGLHSAEHACSVLVRKTVLLLLKAIAVTVKEALGDACSSSSEGSPRSGAGGSETEDLDMEIIGRR